jgi:hypothetical protein
MITPFMSARAGQSARTSDCAAARHPASRRRAQTNGPSNQALQNKPCIGAVDDPLEREADRVADAVVSGAPLPALGGASTALQAKCAECEAEETVRRQPEEEEDQETIQAKADAGGPATEGAAQAASAVASGGAPLSPGIRSYFEPRFGRDLSGVRVHSDGAAARAARQINARAYTLGHSIAFASGEYAPASQEGRRLIAHELAHVAQQSGGDSTVRRQQDAGPEPRWGPFELVGSASFIERVRSDLNLLNGTTQGRALISTLARYYGGNWLHTTLRIREGRGCGLDVVPANPAVDFNPGGCVTQDCPIRTDRRWLRVPNAVYLHHELVHVYIYNIRGEGTHRDRECMATGLGRYATQMPYNENRLRCELGLPVRPCYGGECAGHDPPTCEQIAAADAQAALTEEREARRRAAAEQEAQLGCVIRLGGCPQSRSGGMPSEGDYARYNAACRSESGYSGPDLVPSEQECRGRRP